VTATVSTPEVLDVEAAVADIADPEIPVLTLGDLGIVREVRVDEAAGTAYVALTPTYSGCPATRMIEELVIHVVRKAGLTPQVETRLTPAWTTDWISERGRARLKEFGIAPPGEKPEPEGSQLLTLTVRQVACPLCGSNDTEEISRFGSTACKALRRCRSCREPFDEFKAI
jgi:ring-1,2-phenylacetyl-CoA epoxidase subunit PaaD